MARFLLPLLCFFASALAAPGQVATVQPAPGPSAGADGPSRVHKRVIGYFVEWGIYARGYDADKIPLEKVTHLNYAFANIGSDLKIALGDSYAAIDRYYPGDTWNQPYRGNYNRINNTLRAQYPQIRTLISVGGWTWSGLFSDVALSSQSRATFAASCVDFLRQYNFDGVDLDWEYPGGGGLSSNTTRPQDKQNFTLLLAEMRAQLDAAAAQDGRPYLLTIAAPAGFDKIANIEADLIHPYLDWINVMTYDFHGAWNLSHSNHHAQLRANPNDPDADPLVAALYNGDAALQAYLAAGVPADKLTLGIPFYGHAWGGVAPGPFGDGLFEAASFIPPGTWDDWQSGPTGVNDYTEIEQFAAGAGYTRHWDPALRATWLYSPSLHGGHFISFEDSRSLGVKVDYVQRLGLGGMMFWEFSGDRNEVLLDQIWAGMGH